MILTGCRSSLLARAQFYEVQQMVGGALLEPVWVDTIGDKDQTTSLRDLDKTDFFTRELDQMLLNKIIRIAIHSAKDLPDPLPNGLILIGLTVGLDPRDSLVLRPQDTLESLPWRAKIATSSVRREESVKKLRSDFCFVDVRGTIQKRLSLLYCARLGSANFCGHQNGPAFDDPSSEILLQYSSPHDRQNLSHSEDHQNLQNLTAHSIDTAKVDGVVIAEAALIRLKLKHLNRIILNDKSAPLQGRLAIVARSEDHAMRALFATLFGT